MKKLRYNCFNHMHKALRAMLFDTAMSLQHTDFEIQDEAVIAIEKVRFTLENFQSHIVFETQFILPMIVRYDAQLVELIEAEYKTHQLLKTKIELIIEKFEAQQHDDGKLKLGYQLMRTFNELAAFNLYLMNKEEKLVNECLWAYFTDLEILTHHQMFINNMPRDVRTVSSIWMMRGMSKIEIAHWLQQVKNNAPTFVYNELLEITRRELNSTTWTKVESYILPQMVMS